MGEILITAEILEIRRTPRICDGDTTVGYFKILGGRASLGFTLAQTPYGYRGAEEAAGVPRGLLKYLPTGCYIDP